VQTRITTNPNFPSIGPMEDAHAIEQDIQDLDKHLETRYEVDRGKLTQRQMRLQKDIQRSGQPNSLRCRFVLSWVYRKEGYSKQLTWEEFLAKVCRDHNEYGVGHVRRRYLLPQNFRSVFMFTGEVSYHWLWRRGRHAMFVPDYYLGRVPGLIKIKRRHIQPPDKPLVEVKILSSRRRRKRA
jgi:hypothetical protein